MLTPDNNAELAHIHFLLEKSWDWSSPLRRSIDKIKQGELVDASMVLRSHIATYQHLADRLDAVAASDEAIAAA